MHPDDVCKTAIITPFGLYEFLRMPFGLRNSAQSFQRLMDEILRGLDFVFVYIDDVLIASHTSQQHMEHFRIVFNRFREYGIVINPAKCEFGSSEIDFLGFHINEFGSTPTNAKVQAILDYEKPNTITDLRRFVCMLNFYRRFIPNAAHYQAPLNEYMKGAKKKDKWK